MATPTRHLFTLLLLSAVHTPTLLAQCADWRSGVLIQVDAAAGASANRVGTWDPDGPGPQTPRLLIGGYFTEFNNKPLNRIAMWNGTSWQGLGSGLTGSCADCPYHVNAITTWDPDGLGPLFPQPIVGGYFEQAGGVAAEGIARWDGAAWQPIGTTEAGLGGVLALTTWDPDGGGPLTPRLIAGGGRASLTTSCVTYWNGATWFDLGPPINGGNAAAVVAFTNWDPDGAGPLIPRLVAAGYFDTVGGTPRANIVMWDGTNWLPLGDGLSPDDNLIPRVTALTTWDPDGAGPLNAVIVAAGRFTHSGATPLTPCAYWDGAWHPFPGIINDFDRSDTPMVTWDHDANSATPDRLFVGYAAHFLNGPGQWGRTRDSLGASWTNFGGSEDFGPLAMTTWDHDGSAATPARLVASGLCELSPGPIGTYQSRVHEFDGTDWRRVAPAPIVHALADFGGRAIAAGDFQAELPPAPYVPPANSILAWDGVDTSSFGDGLNGAVNALYSYAPSASERELIAAGSFTEAGGVAANRVARWREGSTALVPPAWEPMGGGFSAAAYAIERYNNAYHVGGAFTPFLGSRVSRWTGSAWVSAGSSTSGPNGTVYALRSFGGALYAGGDFDAITALGFPTTGALARWNGSAWSEVTATDLNGVVYAMAVHNGELIIGGQFTGVAGSPNIVRFNGTSFSAIGAGGAIGTVRSLVSKGGFLYAGGDMSSIGGVAVANLARWNGAAWEPVSGGTDGSVRALLGFKSEVHAGGAFARVRTGAIHAPAWARWSEDGVPWIARHPVSIMHACLGANVSFTGRAADGYGGLMYTWRRSGLPLTMGPTPGGSTLSTSGTVLNIAGTGTADAGEYTLTISNACGGATSDVAALSLCAGDFNCTGDLTVQDIFDFLAAYFGGQPSADINDSGGLSVQDIFDFLAVYFAGCA